MAKVISKLRAYSPNKKDTPTGNIKHLYYIATRKNAVINEYGSSIFGYYNYENLRADIQKKDDYNIDNIQYGSQCRGVEGFLINGCIEN